MVIAGSKVKLLGRPTRGVTFTVLSINKYGKAIIKHSLSGLVYIEHVSYLVLVK